MEFSSHLVYFFLPMKVHPTNQEFTTFFIPCQNHQTRPPLIFFFLQIGTYFAEKLLTIVSDILLHFKGKGKSESVGPSNSELDPHLHKGGAALEFIKHICAVLALDQNVQHDILVNLY